MKKIVSLSLPFYRKRNWVLSNLLTVSEFVPHQGSFGACTLKKKCDWSVSSVSQSCLTRYDPMNYSTPGLPVHHQLPEFTQPHVHWVCDAIQASHHLSSPSPPALHISQHHGLFKWVSSLRQVAKVLEFQLQHQFFQWLRIWECLILAPEEVWPVRKENKIKRQRVSQEM